MLNAGRIAEVLTDRFGVPLVGQAADDAEGQHARLRPRDLVHTQGFAVDVLIGWRTVDVNFAPGTYAAQLLVAMAASDPDQRSAFRTFMQAAVSDGAKVAFQINGQNTDPLHPEKWPSEWRSLSLSLTRGPMVIDGKDPAVMEALAISWGGRMVGSVLSLMPLEPVQPPVAGEAEGGAYQALVTKYERSQINRAACVEIHGAKCKVCGFDFGKFYGPIGVGFIEVHHVESVSLLEPGTILDPATDLVPLCSNCHSMAHKRRPLPYTVDELKAMIREAEER
jgi:5-methylcytosine-specific restriction protein A